MATKVNPLAAVSRRTANLTSFHMVSYTVQEPKGSTKNRSA
jgi:hypothetical protein